MKSTKGERDRCELLTQPEACSQKVEYHYEWRSNKPPVLQPDLHISDVSLRYRFQYVELIPPAFKSAALAFGSAIHEAVGAFYHEILTGDELRPDQMLDVYRQAWQSRDGSEIRFFNGDDEQSLIEKAGQMLTVFHEAFDPGVQVLGIENSLKCRSTKMCRHSRIHRPDRAIRGGSSQCGGSEDSRQETDKGTGR